MFTDHRSLSYCYPHEQCRRTDPSAAGHCALSVRHNWCTMEQLEGIGCRDVMPVAELFRRVFVILVAL